MSKIYTYYPDTGEYIVTERHINPFNGLRSVSHGEFCDGCKYYKEKKDHRKDKINPEEPWITEDIKNKPKPKKGRCNYPILLSVEPTGYLTEWCKEHEKLKTKKEN